MSKVIGILRIFIYYYYLLTRGEGVVTKMITSFMNDPFRIYASLILAGLCNEQVTGVQIFRNICVMTKEIITISDIC